MGRVQGSLFDEAGPEVGGGFGGETRGALGRWGPIRGQYLAITDAGDEAWRGQGLGGRTGGSGV